jgi:hypothetical protein
MRFPGGTGGGGTGGEGGDDSGDADDDADETDEDDKGDGDEDDADDKGEDDKKEKDPELAKAIARRDRALARAKKAEAALAEATKKKDGDEPDPVKVAETKIVRTAAHGILRGLGIEDKEDRATVLDMLRLDDVEVDDDGADEDAIEERLADLRRILGGGKPAARKVPKTTSTKDKGGSNGDTSDPDRARWQRIMGRTG